jgi:hypothetical protein
MSTTRDRRAKERQRIVLMEAKRHVESFWKYPHMKHGRLIDDAILAGHDLESNRQRPENLILEALALDPCELSLGCCAIGNMDAGAPSARNIPKQDGQPFIPQAALNAIRPAGGRDRSHRESRRFKLAPFARLSLGSFDPDKPVNELRIRPPPVDFI